MNIADRVRQQVLTRPCHICRVLGACEHREYRVELAIARAAEKREANQEPRIYTNQAAGAMVPSFEERLFSLPVGEVSEPFQTL